MLPELKEQVWQANLDLVREGLVVHTFGNASGIDRHRGLVVIKPSGVPYDGLRPEHMVTVCLETGRTVGEGLRPSSDTPTHLELYRAFPSVGGVVHTHSLLATAWPRPAATFPPSAPPMPTRSKGRCPAPACSVPAEITEAYEANTGRVIVERFRDAIRSVARGSWSPVMDRSPGEPRPPRPFITPPSSNTWPASPGVSRPRPRAAGNAARAPRKALLAETRTLRLLWSDLTPTGMPPAHSLPGSRVREYQFFGSSTLSR